MKFEYVMKASVNSTLQLKDRISKFENLRLPPFIELFISSSEDILGKKKEEVIKRCLKFSDCKYIVHFPTIDLKNKYIFDMYNDEENKVDALLDFCKKIKSGALIIHRCFGFNRNISKSDAEEGFIQKIISWNKRAEDRHIQILVENYGFVWLPEGFGIEYVVSPLDHFFPWDIQRFHNTVTQLKLNSIGLLLDIAHVVLSSNMFNLLKRYPQLKLDNRFSNIYDSDLNQRKSLEVSDFVFDFIHFFHISDSFIWEKCDGITELKKYLYSEGLPIGHGNINYTKVFKNIKKNKVLIMEINPESGDYNNNDSQLKAVKWFRKIFC